MNRQIPVGKRKVSGQWRRRFQGLITGLAARKAMMLQKYINAPNRSSLSQKVNCRVFISLLLFFCKALFVKMNYVYKEMARFSDYSHELIELHGNNEYVFILHLEIFFNTNA